MRLVVEAGVIEVPAEHVHVAHVVDLPDGRRAEYLQSDWFCSRCGKHEPKPGYRTCGCENEDGRRFLCPTLVRGHDVRTVWKSVRP